MLIEKKINRYSQVVEDDDDDNDDDDNDEYGFVYLEDEIEEEEISVYDKQDNLISKTIMHNGDLNSSILNEAFVYLQHYLDMDPKKIMVHPKQYKKFFDDNMLEILEYKDSNTFISVIVKKLWGAKIESSDKVDENNIYVIGTNSKKDYSIVKIILEEEE